MEDTLSSFKLARYFYAWRDTSSESVDVPSAFENTSPDSNDNAVALPSNINDSSATTTTTTAAMDDSTTLTNESFAFDHQVDPPYVQAPPYSAVILAGGLGGSTADCIMHSIDTIKTRIQGQPYPQKYTGFIPAYRTVFAEEGLRRGLYGGWTPAMIGSLSGTMIYFGFYEWTKRNLIGQGTPDSIAHLTAGAFGDFMASFIFVPSEVLKTRMQLQGRYNNPHFVSGYNYHNFLHAFRTIVSTEGPMTLYHGYKATLLRDAPFSALQFAFYERLKVLAMDWHATDVQHATKIADSGLPATTELIVGAVAGGAAGGLTTPLDVIKTMLQTQQEEKPKRQRSSAPAHAATNLQYRYITGVNDGLRQIWRQEGIPGLFRGFTPRICITSLQSAIMFFIYERILARIMHMKSMYASSSTSPSSSLS